MNFSFQEISDEIPLMDRPHVDQMKEMPDDPILSEWWNNGVVILKNFIPDEVINQYCELRQKLPFKGGWSCPTPYMYYRQIKEISLYAPLYEKLKHIMGKDVGLHLNLTGWVSTERAWHQDDYLNPPDVKTNYLATWIALDDISADSGPFEYVPGSHRWPVIRREKLFKFFPEGMSERDTWPTESQEAVHSACESEILANKIEPVKFIAKKGDVLIWHGSLMHRGSKANVPGMERKAIISHYSALTHRPDMPLKAYYEGTHGSGYYFVLNVPMKPEEKI